MSYRQITFEGKFVVPTKRRSLANQLTRQSRTVQHVIRQLTSRRLIPHEVARRFQPVGEHRLSTASSGSFTYVAHEDDLLAREIVWDNLRKWEPTTQKVIARLAGVSQSFADIGAYSGIYTLIACASNPELTAIAIEPNPHAVTKLEANIRANDLSERATILPYAVANRDGHAEMIVPADATASHLLTHSLEPGETAICVPVRKGDEILADSQPDLIKIDVEGLELECLQSMLQTLARTHPRIIVECLDVSALTSVKVLLGGQGYGDPWHLAEDGLVPVADVESHASPPDHFWNYLFLHEGDKAARQHLDVEANAI